MAAAHENRFWRDPALRRTFFDLDAATGRYRRFFDIDDLAGVRVEDPEVFETTHAKPLELVREGLVQGLRIDHVDGLADPARVPRAAEGRGPHVWVEKILEPGERAARLAGRGDDRLRVRATTRPRSSSTRPPRAADALYAEVTGERRTFAEVAAEAKLEQARDDVRGGGRAAAAARRPAVSRARARVASRLPHVRRARSGRVEEADRRVAARGVPDAVRADAPAGGAGAAEFVVRFQQTSGAGDGEGCRGHGVLPLVRLLALNEVGGDPGGSRSRSTSSTPRTPSAPSASRGTCSPGRRTTRSAAPTCARGSRRSAGSRTSGRSRWWRRVGVSGEDEYLALQTVVGAWPLSAERLDPYLEKALREGKRTSSWLDPDEAAEAAGAGVRPGAAREPRRRGVRRARAPAGDRIALGMTLLRATAPGVPDIYEGDELELLALVDPDNRRPVDWDLRRRALADPPPKLRVLREALALRARRPDAFGHEYERVDAGLGRVRLPARRLGPGRGPDPRGRHLRPAPRLARPPPGPPGAPARTGLKRSGPGARTPSQECDFSWRVAAFPVPGTVTEVRRSYMRDFRARTSAMYALVSGRSPLRDARRAPGSSRPARAARCRRTGRAGSAGTRPRPGRRRSSSAAPASRASTASTNSRVVAVTCIGPNAPALDTTDAWYPDSIHESASASRESTP